MSSAPPAAEGDLAGGVRRLGFRRWYERQLLSSHAHMVLALLATIAVLACLEAMRGAEFATQATNLIYAGASTAIGAWAIRRYVMLLRRAEDLANQAVCTACGEYGRFRVVTDRRAQNETEVCCLRCAHTWLIISD